MKPFDLEKALAGEPVRLRNGNKAYILTLLNNPRYKDAVILGYSCNENGKQIPIDWCSDGKHVFDCSAQHDYDIIGMWEEPPEMVKIGNFEFPKPEKFIPNMNEEYYAINPFSMHCVSSELWSDTYDDNRLLKGGFVHKTREAAEQHAKVLIAISQGKTSLDE